MIVHKLKQLGSRSFSGKSLLWTNTITSGFLLGGGDAIEQGLERARRKRKLKISKQTPDQLNELLPKFDWTRTGRMFIVGLTQGPPHHIWYTALDKLLPKNNLKTAGVKIIADQIIAAPVFAVTFFYGMGLLQGKDVYQCWKEFVAKFPVVYAFDWLIWPPTQLINFLWIPPHFRVLYVNCITVVWDIFLSYIKHKEKSDSEDSWLSFGNNY